MNNEYQHSEINPPPIGEQSNQLSPSIEAAQQFLKLLDEDSDQFTFLTFDDSYERKKSGKLLKKLTRVFNGSIDYVFNDLSDLNTKGAGVFVTVNETDLKGRKSSNIKRVRAVWQEDDGEGIDLPIEPHIIVNTSPGKYHRYLLTEGCDVFSEAEGVLQALVNDYGSDKAAKDLSRVLRLPGFYHRKNDPHMVSVIHESGTLPYAWETIKAAIPPAEKQTKSHRSNYVSKEDQVLLKLHELGLVKGEGGSPGMVYITCPFSNEHTTASVDSSTVYLLPNHGGYKTANIKCQHAHCADRLFDDYVSKIGLDPSSYWKDQDYKKNNGNGIQRNLDAHVGPPVLHLVDDNDESHFEPDPLIGENSDPEEYPVLLLMEKMSKCALAMQLVTKAPLTLCAQSVLAYASYCAQAHYDVKTPWEQVTPISLYLLSIGNSGERKTIIDKILGIAVNKAQKDDMLQYNKDMTEYKTAMDSYKKAEVIAIRNGGDTLDEITRSKESCGAMPVAPLNPFRRVGDPTVEGLFKLMKTSQPSIAMLSDEGGSFLGSYAMGHDQKMKTLTRLSAMWDGSEFDRVRSGDGADVLYGRRMTFHQMGQPGVMEDLMNDNTAKGQGFLSRCLVAAPKSTIGTRFIDRYDHVDPQDIPDIARFNEWQATMLRKELNVNEDDHQCLEPHVLTLDPSAMKFSVKAQNEFEKLCTDPAYKAYTENSSKAMGMAFRVAGVLFAVEGTAIDRYITEEMLKNAVKLVKWYLDEGIRASSECTSGTESTTDAVEMIEWIKDGGYIDITKRIITQFVIPAILRKDKIRREAAISELIESGHLRQNPPGTIIEGKKTRISWHVNRDDKKV